MPKERKSPSPVTEMSHQSSIGVGLKKEEVQPWSSSDVFNIWV